MRLTVAFSGDVSYRSTIVVMRGTKPSGPKSFSINYCWQENQKYLRCSPPVFKWIFQSRPTSSGEALHVPVIVTARGTKPDPQKLHPIALSQADHQPTLCLSSAASRLCSNCFFGVVQPRPATFFTSSYSSRRGEQNLLLMTFTRSLL